MSKNHQFIEFDTQVVERWVKTSAHMVSGKRFNPYKPSETIDWVLRTNPANFDFNKINKAQHPDAASKITFVYEDEVLELYSENEARLFRRLNKGLIERGLLKQYFGSPTEVNTVNTISDQELEDIANATTIAAFKKKLYNLSSAVTVGRLITVLKNLDKKSSYISAAEEYFKELQ